MDADVSRSRGHPVSYEDFIRSKSDTPVFAGIRDVALADHLFPHQRDLVTWALRKGRSAIFADTGLGKTAMQIEWARHVPGRVLVLAPLAVAEQSAREAGRWGVDMRYLREDDASQRIVITNYDILDHFDPAAFSGVVLDESSILKSFTGATRNALIERFQSTPYRLACTATPAPNDHTELGNHSEFLGIKTRTEMLAEYFVHDGGSTQDWRLKGHAVDAFWRWVCTWGAVVKRPSDLGHSDDGFILPPLRMHEHIVKMASEDAFKVGRLFVPDAATLADQRATRRATMDARVVMAAELASGSEPCIVWCELNDEADNVEKTIGSDAVQVAGSDDRDAKVERLVGFASGKYRVMVTKQKVAGFGMNWQHCNRMIFLGASHSFEGTYQAVRRCYRFGQTRPVDVHVIRAENEQAIVANFRRKEADAERLAEEMVARVRDAMRIEVGATGKEWNPYDPRVPMTVPAWVGVDDQP